CQYVCTIQQQSARTIPLAVAEIAGRAGQIFVAETPLGLATAPGGNRHQRVNVEVLNLLAAPMDKPISTLDMLAGHIPNAKNAHQPIQVPVPVSILLETVQLAL